MWAAGYFVGEVQRRGWWVSQRFRMYIWVLGFGKDASAQNPKGAGSRVLKAKVSMFATMQSQANRDLREQLQHQRVWL